MAAFARSDDLRGAEFAGTDLRGARFIEADLSDVVMRGVRVAGADIDAPWLCDGESFLRVNGVDVIPLVEAELNRRLPGRAGRRAGGGSTSATRYATSTRSRPSPPNKLSPSPGPGTPYRTRLRGRRGPDAGWHQPRTVPELGCAPNCHKSGTASGRNRRLTGGSHLDRYGHARNGYQWAAAIRRPREAARQGAATSQIERMRRRRVLRRLPGACDASMTSPGGRAGRR